MGSFIPNSRHQARSHGLSFCGRRRRGRPGPGRSRLVHSRLRPDPGIRARRRRDAMLISLLPRLVQHANAAVHDRTLAPEFRGKKMATTVVACALRHDQAIVSHVGDSRCYLVRKGVARQITQDHTWVNEQRKMGVISANDVATSDSRHVLIRSLGPEMFVSPDTTALTIQPADVLVLCSDGLHDETAEDDDRCNRLAEQARRGDCPRACGPRGRDRWQRQHHGAGYSHPLGGAGGHVPRPPLSAASLKHWDLHGKPYEILRVRAPFLDRVERAKHWSLTPNGLSRQHRNGLANRLLPH